MSGACLTIAVPKKLIEGVLEAEAQLARIKQEPIPFDPALRTSAAMMAQARAKKEALIQAAERVAELAQIQLACAVMIEAASMQEEEKPPSTK